MKLTCNNDIATFYPPNGTARKTYVSNVANKMFDDFIPPSNKTPPLLPESIRWISDDGHQFLVERPPGRILVGYRHGTPSNGIDRAELESYSIAVPWQLYKVDLTRNSISVFFSNLPITSLEEIVGLPPLANIDQYGVACLGKEQVKQMEYALAAHHTIPHILNDAMNDFWMHEFNDDMVVFTLTTPIDLLKLPEIQEAIAEDPRNKEYFKAHPEPDYLDNNTIDHYFTVPSSAILKALEKMSVEEVCTIAWSKTYPDVRTIGSLLSGAGMGNGQSIHNFLIGVFDNPISGIAAVPPPGTPLPLSAFDIALNRSAQFRRDHTALSDRRITAAGRTTAYRPTLQEFPESYTLQGTPPQIAPTTLSGTVLTGQQFNATASEASNWWVDPPPQTPLPTPEDVLESLQAYFPTPETVSGVADAVSHALAQVEASYEESTEEMAIAMNPNQPCLHCGGFGDMPGCEYCGENYNA